MSGEFTYQPKWDPKTALTTTAIWLFGRVLRLTELAGAHGALRLLLLAGRGATQDLASRVTSGHGNGAGGTSGIFGENKVGLGFVGHLKICETPGFGICVGPRAWIFLSSGKHGMTIRKITKMEDFPQ